MKISTILRRAAENYLWDGERQFPFDLSMQLEEMAARCSLTCVAVAEAEGCGLTTHSWKTTVARSPAIQFLKALGVKPGKCDQFNGFAPGPERQAVRFAWLMHASRVAREMGV